MNKRRKETRLLATFLIPGILTLAAVLNMLYFQVRTQEWTKQWAYRVLAASAQEQTATLGEIFNGRFGILETFASSVGAQWNQQRDVLTLDNIRTRMTAMVETSGFEHLAIAGTDGVAYANDGQTDDSSDRFYMTEALAGRRAIQALTDSRLYEKQRFVLAVPLHINGKVAGAVMGSFTSSDLRRLIVSTAFSGNAYSYLCDSAGNVIIEAEATTLLQRDNLLDAIAAGELEILDRITLETLADDLKAGSEGVVAFSSGAERRYGVYQPVGINDWYIFNFVPAAVVDSSTASQNRLGALSIGIITLCAVLLLVITGVREKRRIRELQRLQAEQLVHYRTDPVNGLLNMQGFEQAAREELDALPPETFCALVDFGAKNFALFNVSFGGPAANAVLKAMAETLLAHCLKKQPCARLSGDRFAVLVTACTCERDLRERIAALSAAMQTRHQTKQLDIAYGVYIIDARTLPVDEMCTRAIAARLQLKEGAGNVGFYDQTVHQRQIEDSVLLEDMEDGLRLGQFVPYYQPKYDARTERIVGAEALVRWLRPAGEVKPPDRFIQLFEQNGLITRLDAHMFEQVCKKLAHMPAPVPISVNFSRAHLYQPDFPESLLAIAARYRVSPSLLEIELTETAFFDQRDTLMRNMNRLRELGFLVSIDDFGSGYSSLNLLKDIHADVVKIDKGFLSESTETERGITVLESVLSLAKALKVRTVAEGVETVEQLELLRENGCDTIQGYYFCRPVPETEFDRLLKEQRGK